MVQDRATLTMAD